MNDISISICDLVLLVITHSPQSYMSVELSVTTHLTVLMSNFRLERHPHHYRVCLSPSVDLTQSIIPHF